jgi:hypothetical protein
MYKDPGAAVHLRDRPEAAGVCPFRRTEKIENLDVFEVSNFTL